jgi:hypothetical protein
LELFRLFDLSLFSSPPQLLNGEDFTRLRNLSRAGSRTDKGCGRQERAVWNGSGAPKKGGTMMSKPDTKIFFDI